SNLFLSLILHLGNLFLIVQLHFSKLFLILKSGVNHTSRGSISTSTLPSIKLRKCSSKIITSILSFISGRLVLTSVTPASSAPVLQTPKATSSTLYFDSLTVNAGNGGFLHCIQMDTSVNAANQ